MTTPEIQALQNISINKTCLELGAWQGFSTVCMALVAKLVVSIDSHGGDLAVEDDHTFVPYLNNLVRYKVLPRVAMLVGRTEDVVPRLQGLQFDVIFIDATHSYEACKIDTDNCIPLLASGGLMAWHDYERDKITGPGFGVTEVVNETMKYHFFQKVDQVDTLVVCKKMVNH